MNTTLRNTIKTIDNYLFAGVLTKLNRKRWKVYNYLYYSSLIQYIYVRKINAVFNYNNQVCFASKQQNYLGRLFDKYGSDKGYNLEEKNKHSPEGQGYSDIYELLFFRYKQKTKLVLECGIGSKNHGIPSNMSWSKNSIPGASLRAWRDYFPNANIIGVDIDPDVMFTEDRISTFVCDQTSKQSINSFIQQTNLKPRSADIIIDDGLHNFNANITFFESTKHLLKDNGIYIIEDFWVRNKEQQQFINYFKNLANYHVQFIKYYNAYSIVITNKYA